MSAVKPLREDRPWRERRRPKEEVEEEVVLGPSGPPKSTDGLANVFDEDTTRLAARRFMAGAVIGGIGGTALGMGESSRRGAWQRVAGASSAGCWCDKLIHKAPLAHVKLQSGAFPADASLWPSPEPSTPVLCPN